MISRNILTCTFNSNRDIACFWNKCLVGAKLQGLRECKGLDDFTSPKPRHWQTWVQFAAGFAFIVMNCVDN